MTSNDNDDSFVVRYTNKDIMEKLEEISSKVDDAVPKIKINSRLIKYSFVFTSTVLSFLIGHIMGGWSGTYR